MCLADDSGHKAPWLCGFGGVAMKHWWQTKTICAALVVILGAALGWLKGEVSLEASIILAAQGLLSIFARLGTLKVENANHRLEACATNGEPGCGQTR